MFDSRPGIAVNDPAPGAKAIAGPGATFDIQLLGVGGIPKAPADVLGVVANITVTDPTSTGYLNAYGKDAAAGTAAIINFVAGQTVPNLAIVRPGAEGKLTIKLAAGTGSAHVIVDVFGWFSTSASADLTGARLVPVTPGRILDTRGGLNRDPVGAPLAAGELITVPIRGVDAAEPATTDIVPSSNDVVGVVAQHGRRQQRRRQPEHPPLGDPEQPGGRHRAVDRQPQPRPWPGEVEHGRRAGRRDRRRDPRLQQLGHDPRRRSTWSATS